MRSINYHAFTSDNSAGICPEALEAIARANTGSAPSYGADRWTREACDRLRVLFEKPDAEIFFVFNGTAANSLALASLCQSYHSVICHDYAHVETDECGAPEFFSNGTKLLSTGGTAGKLSPEGVERLITRRTDIHYPKARVLSLSQSTEWGSVYGLDELTVLTALARRHGLAVHMDGARFSNAAASTHLAGLSPADITWRAGVDVLCFGGTKNGMNTTEAVIFFNRSLAQDLDYRCKQSGQLASKMRFLSCQWLGLLENGAWLRHAAHANASARRLAEGFRALDLSLVLDPAANAVFVELPPATVTVLRAKGWSFYNFVGAPGYRFMTSWTTQEADINALLADARAASSL